MIAYTSSLPAESVTALIDRIVPPGDSMAQPPGLRLLYSHKELSVKTPNATAAPDELVAAEICWNVPADSIDQPAGVCSHKWRSDVTANTSLWPARSATALIARIVPAGDSTVAAGGVVLRQ